MIGDASAPLRVGLFPSVGRFGRHLIEQFADGGPFQVVAAMDPSALALAPLAAANLVAPFGVRLVSTPQELLQAEDIDVLWATSHDGLRDDFLSAGLDHGKHTIVETPLTVVTALAAKAFAWATQHDRLLLVHHPRRADLDFRQALTVAQDREIGAIRAAKWISWSYGLPPRGATRRQGSLTLDAGEDLPTTKVRFVAHALDQLMALIGDRPLSVSATGDSQAPGTPDLFAGYSLALRIVFETGCQAEIDIRLDSPAPFQSGWTLTGERGGYVTGRRFTLTDDGEVFDSPITLPNSDTEVDQFEWLARQIRSGIRNVAEEARVRTVVALLDAAQRSLTASQVVGV
ncbi:MAG: Gfo/Idh/MocA family oxidoreductase [Planctomycetaceae bacterium]|nr:Gfo/Idh/MocA family oxidoreductase [Planctomycetaceae bacterium]